MHTFLSIIILYKYQNYIKFLLFFFFFFFFLILTYLQTVPLRYLIVNLVKVASCSCVHSFVHSCSKVEWNIKLGM